MLKDPVLETVGAKGEKSWERMSFVVVLPTDPVRAISVKPGLCLRFSRFALARDERASTEFSTRIWGRGQEESKEWVKAALNPFP